MSGFSPRLCVGVARYVLDCVCWCGKKSFIAGFRTGWRVGAKEQMQTVTGCAYALS